MQRTIDWIVFFAVCHFSLYYVLGFVYKIAKAIQKKSRIINERELSDMKFLDAAFIAAISMYWSNVIHKQT